MFDIFWNNKPRNFSVCTGWPIKIQPQKFYSYTFPDNVSPNEKTKTDQTVVLFAHMQMLETSSRLQFGVFTNFGLYDEAHTIMREY